MEEGPRCNRVGQDIIERYVVNGIDGATPKTRLEEIDQN
tara:strand:+ start:475 stop:591 length:117 start_codon:yes stop_codon:yes gene_type:complete